MSKNREVAVQKNGITEGVIWQQILIFFFPILFGTFFQQLYNTADAIIVGRFVGKEALSAVGGTTGTLINLLVGFFVGMSSGSSVVVSQYYGARNSEMVKKSVHTAFCLAIGGGICLMIIGELFAPAAIRAMGAPEEIMDYSVTYMRIYFLGVIGNLLYNMGAAILRAVGDSQKPFYFLVASAITNVVLDLVFVLAFDMGVAGVAWATIIAQGVSATLVIITLLRTDTCVKVSLSRLRVHGSVLAKIVKLGIPAAIQMAVTSFSNIFVQSYINYFGESVIGGWTSYSKIDQLVLLPMQSISLASTTFVGQNLGIGNEKRARRGVTTALLMAFASTIILMIPVMIFAPSLAEFFNAGSMAYGTLFLRYLSPFYVLCCMNQIYAGALRGSGNTTVPMIVMLSSFVFFRQIYLFVMANYISNTVLPIAMSYPAGWLVCSTVMFIYFKRAKLIRTRIVDDAPMVTEENEEKKEETIGG